MLEYIKIKWRYCRIYRQFQINMQTEKRRNIWRNICYSLHKNVYKNRSMPFPVHDCSMVIRFWLSCHKKKFGYTRMKTMFCLKMVKTDFGSIPLGSKRVMCQINLELKLKNNNFLLSLPNV